MDESVIVTLRGEYDIDRLPALRRELEKYYDHPYVVVDLTQVKYCDSKSLCEFIRMRKIRAAAGIRPATYVVNNDRFGRLFRFLGLDEIFTVVESLEDAVTQQRKARLTAS